MQLQLVRHVDDGAHDIGIVRVVGQIADEGLVNLQVLTASRLR
jgi:hypothetical protein